MEIMKNLDLNPSVKLCKINLPSSCTQIHPACVVALTTWLELLPYTFENVTQLKTNTLLEAFIPKIFFVKNLEDQNLIVSGYEGFKQASRGEVRKHNCIELEGIDEQGIELISWRDVVNLKFSNTDGWLIFRSLVNSKMPQTVIQLYFRKRRISFSLLSELSGIPTSTLKRSNGVLSYERS